MEGYVDSRDCSEENIFQGRVPRSSGSDDFEIMNESI